MKPGHETSPSAGSAIPDAATAGTPTASAMTRRSWTGTLAATNTGAARKAAPGRIIASIQSWNIASTLGMSVGFIDRLSHQRTNLSRSVAGEIGDTHTDDADTDGKTKRGHAPPGHEYTPLLIYQRPNQPPH